MIERFQEGKEYLPILSFPLKPAATGLNLTGANHVFHLTAGGTRLLKIRQLIGHSV
jgi:hypothetical protein